MHAVHTAMSFNFVVGALTLYQIICVIKKTTIEFSL